MLRKLIRPILSQKVNKRFYSFDNKAKLLEYSDYVIVAGGVAVGIFGANKFLDVTDRNSPTQKASTVMRIGFSLSGSGSVAGIGLYIKCIIGKEMKRTRLFVMVLATQWLGLCCVALRSRPF